MSCRARESSCVRDKAHSPGAHVSAKYRTFLPYRRRGSSRTMASRVHHRHHFGRLPCPPCHKSRPMTAMHAHHRLETHPLGHRRRRDSRAAARRRHRSSCRTACRLVDELPFLPTAERRFMSQVQGRTYANLFGLVERFINAKVLEVSRDHWFGDQSALEALVRFSDEELKHQELFRRVEALAAEGMPAGLSARRRSATTVAQRRARQVDLGRAGADLPHRDLHASPLPQEHRARREPVGAVEGRVLVSLEGRVAARDPRRARVAARGREARPRRTRDRAVTDLIELVAAVDGILQARRRPTASTSSASTGAHVLGRTSAGDPSDRAQSLSLAVHRLRRAGRTRSSACSPSSSRRRNSKPSPTRSLR